MGRKTRSVIFADWVPEGMPDPDKHFRFEDGELPDEVPDGNVLIKALYISVDPYMRGRMKDTKSYFASFTVGKPLNGGVVGEVIESKHEGYAVGDTVVGALLDWSDYQLVDINAQPAGRAPMKVPETGLPKSYALGVLGMPGATAYFGLLEVCNPQAGETVVVSGAAGAVGCLVGQIAKIKGATVVGIAGSDEKLKWITEELGFDAGINYKTCGDMTAAIKEKCPNGVDVYFDNVGGTIDDAAMYNINNNGRVSLCGAISSYNDAEAQQGPRWNWVLISKSVKREGFIVTKWLPKWPAAFGEIGGWLQAGKLKYRETVVEGLDNLPAAFVQMMSGKNFGKMVVKI